MLAFAQQQSRVQSSRLVSPARPDRTIGRPARGENPLVAQRQSLSNQTVQRLLRSRAIQAKLAVNKPPGDQYEQEADRVAEQVMRMPDPATATEGADASGRARGAHLQRMCSECEEELHRQPMEEETLQAKEVAGRTPEVMPGVASQIDSMRGGGQPLPESVRAFFEPHFGHDFSQVRVHRDADAAASALAVNARAYTVGRDVMFGAGQYAPEMTAGRRLLAHELTHVVQQNQSSHSPPAVQRQPAVPAYRDCTPSITGIADANEKFEAARLRAREYIGAARGALAAAPAAGTTYATALNRHFVAPAAADRASIEATYGQILGTLVVSNYICNSTNICGTEQAFWIPDDELVHACPSFWSSSLDTTCRAIILIHEGAHDVGVDAAVAGDPPYRGGPQYPAGNVGPPAGETTAGRMIYPDAYAFFAAHIWRNTDTGRTCFP